MYMLPRRMSAAADGDNQLIESNVVSEYLDVQYRSSGVKLFPEDPLQLAKVRFSPRCRCDCTTPPALSFGAFGCVCEDTQAPLVNPDWSCASFAMLLSCPLTSVNNLQKNLRKHQNIWPKWPLLSGCLLAPCVLNLSMMYGNCVGEMVCGSLLRNLHAKLVWVAAS